MDPAYWKTCFSGCDHEVARQYITEGSGTIDQDGIGIFREPIEYMSYSDDYEYIADITLRDPLSGEEVSTS